ncbi:MAG: ribonucleotide-diphosphate reductase subunit beta [Bacteroidota bacterium]
MPVPVSSLAPIRPQAKPAPAKRPRDKHWTRYQKAKKLAWDPQHFDLTQDQADWAQLDETERAGVLGAVALFLGGEEAVAADLAPLLVRLRRRPEYETACYFLASQIWEEAKHAEFFSRWLREVAGNPDLEAYASANATRLFDKVLPTNLDAVLTDESDEALVRAITTYHVVIEGMLAESGYHGFYRSFEANGILPGLVQGIRHIQRDEARHIAFGLDLLRGAFARSPETRDVFEATIEAHFDTALGIVADYFAPFGEANPFGLTAMEQLEFAATQLTKRQAALS